MAGANTHRCEARSKATGEQCKRLTTWRSKGGKWLCPMHGRNDRNPGGPPKANRNSVKTGENAAKVLSRSEEFERDRAAAPIDPTPGLQRQMRDTYARLQFMYRLLLQTEQRMMDLAATGDVTALGALAVVEVSRKQEPHTETADGKTVSKLVNVELSEKCRSLLDTWHSQHEAITRVELLYGRTAERLKPKDNEPPPDAGADKLDQLVERMEAAARAASVQPETS